MTQRFKFSYREFKITTINMVSPLMEKDNDMTEQMSNVSRDVETLRIFSMQEPKTTVAEMWDAPGSLASRLGLAAGGVIRNRQLPVNGPRMVYTLTPPIRRSWRE